MIQKELLLQKIIRNPDLDLIGVWKGHGFSSQKNSRFDSRARIRIWKGEPNYVLFTDLDERDTGVSITNCCENLATLVRRDFELDEETIWYEHYSRANNPHLEEEFSEIKLQWNTQKNNYLRPIWKPLTKKSIEKAIEGKLEPTEPGLNNLPTYRFQVPVG